MKVASKKDFYVFAQLKGFTMKQKSKKLSLLKKEFDDVKSKDFLTNAQKRALRKNIKKIITKQDRIIFKKELSNVEHE